MALLLHKIRHATVSDCEDIVHLLQEQEQTGKKRKAPSVDELKTHCFDGENSFNILIAEMNDKDSAKRDNNIPLVGYLLYNYHFCVFDSKSLRITDAYISAVSEHKENILRSLVGHLVKERVKAGEKRTPPSVDDLKTHCFNGENLSNILIAEWNHKDPSKADNRPSTGPLVGYMFYHYIYSTWESKSIEITDMYVLPLPEYESICEDLFHFLCKMSVDENCARVQWQTNGNNDLKNLGKSFNAMNLIEMESWRVKNLEKHKLKEISATS
ncbi:uncharacterized protein LOC115216299 isoform X1 [Octopus sinensis]|uniref:Uncharacterized protein LOC115216299 isoform X1 n=1 Tax=Octopus sinensis TaxID=2607531 RepID=A0A7E6F5M4_9MOLL|nr:uncharacterized protein LOC115216299 isoform X1 [Octopus sinensis]